MTLTEKLDRLPPCICRLLAEDDDGALMTDVELRALLGWNRFKLERVSRAKSWLNIAVGDADNFMKACGIRWSSQRKERERLKLAASRGIDGVRRLRHLRNPAAQPASVAMLLRRTEELLKNSR